MKVMGIDPGMRECGAALLDTGPAVLAADTIRTTPKGADFTDQLRRARFVTARLVTLAREWEPSVIVVEGWQDQTWKGPTTSAWGTVLVIGMLDAALRIGEYDVAWQLPNTVLTATSDWRVSWARDRRLIPGDKMLTNDHKRCAAAHALYWMSGRGNHA